FTGDRSYEDISRAHQAKLSILMCHRSINYTNKMMEQKWGVPWLKVNYIGIDGTIKALRHIAKFFDDEEINKQTEKVIKNGLAMVKPHLEYYRQRLSGKKVIIFAGASRSDHYLNLFETLGMEVVVAGYQFAHRDDYEGRKILPEIKQRTSSAVIDDLTFERQADARGLDEKKIAELRREIPLMDYKGMMIHVKDGHVIVDDFNHYETERLIETFQPDLFCSGIKDKYVAEKMGVPSRQIHSYDYSGPYAGFEGFINFAGDLDMAINSPTWKFAVPPWKQEQ
ncbi:MAG TPA: nitrogenase molybdenum-iron protein alpha chain, partial [Actinobacteria bacterium]|nr:nitrogenase molybdenum-iron protein alpha chain [Actinomycetes bacterium]HEX21074.1 nitrogenase molybdenum-iron protein alpha chain [Actinomycetota bacterium]